MGPVGEREEPLLARMNGLIGEGGHRHGGVEEGESAFCDHHRS